MNTYRVQRSNTVSTVQTASEFVTMRLYSDGKFRCIATGSKDDCIESVQRSEPGKQPNVRALYDAKKFAGYEFTF